MKASFKDVMLLLLVCMLLLSSCKFGDDSIGTASNGSNADAEDTNPPIDGHHWLADKDANMTFADKHIKLTLHNNFVKDGKLLLYFTLENLNDTTELPAPGSPIFKVSDQFIIGSGSAGVSLILNKGFVSLEFGLSEHLQQQILLDGLDIFLNDLEMHNTEHHKVEIQKDSWHFKVPVTYF